MRDLPRQPRAPRLLHLLMVAAIPASAPGLDPASEPPPNVVLILADDLGHGDLGSYGGRLKTPRLDRLADEGLRFTSFYTAQPVCSAARAALLTGCYPNRIGIHGALGPRSMVGIHANEVTLAEALKERGYATGIFGKWHLGHHPEFLPVRHGFDEYFGLPYSNDMWPHHPTAGPSYPPLPLIEGDRVIEYMPDQSRLTTRYTERAVQFIERNRDRPFFLYLPHSMPHVPLHVSEEGRGASGAGLYADVILELDRSVGLVLDALERNGLTRRTLVIFTSDNGPWLSYGDHAGSAGPLREGKGTVWEGGVRVPCIARWPGRVPAGSRCDEPVMSIDLFPTIVKLAGGALPPHPIDGRDIGPLLRGEPGSRSPHEALFFYYNTGDLQALRSGRWKLIFPHKYRTLEGKPGGADGKPALYAERTAGLELYDLETDPGETRDLAAGNPDVVKRLEAAADEAREDLGDASVKHPGRNVREPGRVRRPNVLVILTDDQRWDALGCAGHPHLRTPWIDRLAGEGVRFRNAFSTTSLCSPSRASILSGLYAHAHRVRDNFTEYPDGLPSFPGRLQAGGYETAYIGKWHMGEENDAKRPGFDYFATHKGQGKYYDTEFNVDGERKVVPGYYTQRVTDMAIDWLRRPRSTPFFLMVGHKAPHSFYTPEPKYEHAFDGVSIAYPPTAFQLDDKPGWIRERLDTWHGIYGPLFDFRKKFPDRSPAAVSDFAAMTRAYWATLLSVDESVGRLYETLRELGQLDDTLIIFMSDNGLLSGEHGMVDKRTMHEPSIRIPLIARYPGLVPPDSPRVIDEMVLTVDVAPSILDICGAPPIENVHGRSWKRLARGDSAGWRRSWHYAYDYEKQFPYTPNVRGVRTDEWKYIHYPHGDGGPDRHMAELYDLRNDPGETRNLINDPRQAGKLEELRMELERLLRETGAVPDAMPLDEGIQQRLPEKGIR